MPKILIYGKGFLGKRISEALHAPIADERVVDGSFPDADLYQPDVIINCIGATGRPNVDWCESHKPETYFANVHVPYLLAEYCKKKDIKLVHVSSGCIYQGDNGGKGWSELDTPNFDGSYYSHTKLTAERLLSAYPNTLVLRVRMPIDSIPGDRDLINKLLRYETIMNDENSVTVIADFILALQTLIYEEKTGIWNVTNPGKITHKEILEMYEYTSGEKLNKKYVMADSGEIKTAAPRSNCVLNTDKLEAFMRIRDSHIAIKALLPTYIFQKKVQEKKH